MFDDFFIRALIAGLGIALVTGPLGCFVVWRRLSYFGDTLAHSALLGVTLAYSLDKATFSIGKVLNVSRSEGKVTVHCFAPTADGRLQIRWRPFFIENGAEIFDGSDPFKLVLDAGQVLCLAPLSEYDAVQHSVTRKLDHGKYRVKGPVWEPELDGNLAPSSQVMLWASAAARVTAATERDKAISEYCREASVGTQKVHTVGL